jgi:tetratricopeptide (TPR) repeat protein
VGAICAGLAASSALAGQSDGQLAATQQGGSAAAQSPSTGETAFTRLQRSFSQGVQSAQKRNYAEAFRQLTEALNSPDYDAVERWLNQLGETRALSVMWSTLGDAAWISGHPVEAKAAFAKACEFPDAPATVWTARLEVGVSYRDGPEAQAALTGLASRHGNAGLSRLRDATIISTLNFIGVLPDAATRRQAVLTALLDADWSPKEADFDSRWAILAGRMIEQGDKARADSAVARVTGASTLLTMRLDKRFDHYVQADPAKFDVPAAVRETIERARKAHVEAPADLNKLNSLAAILAGYGEHEESLALADGAIARWNQNSGALPYIDRTSFNWTYDNRARALRSLGRFDEAVSAFAEGAKQPERGAINVSQVLNLANFYLQLGRWNDAIGQAAQIQRGNTSLYGYLFGQRVLACAYDQLGDRPNRDEALKNVMNNSAGQLGITANTLICLNASTAPPS